MHVQVVSLIYLSSSPLNAFWFFIGFIPPPPLLPYMDGRWFLCFLLWIFLEYFVLGVLILPYFMPSASSGLCLYFAFKFLCQLRYFLEFSTLFMRNYPPCMFVLILWEPWPGSASVGSSAFQLLICLRIPILQKSLFLLVFTVFQVRYLIIIYLHVHL
jgi:hypothetical protein